MKRFVFVIAAFLLVNIGDAQVSSAEAFELKAFVGKEGLDTITRENFLKFGKIELNSSKLKVNSFNLSWVSADCSFCDLSSREFKGNHSILNLLKMFYKKEKMKCS